MLCFFLISNCWLLVFFILYFFSVYVVVLLLASQPVIARSIYASCLCAVLCLWCCACAAGLRGYACAAVPVGLRSAVGL